MWPKRSSTDNFNNIKSYFCYYKCQIMQINPELTCTHKTVNKNENTNYEKNLHFEVQTNLWRTAKCRSDVEQYFHKTIQNA